VKEVAEVGEVKHGKSASLPDSGFGTRASGISRCTATEEVKEVREVREVREVLCQPVNLLTVLTACGVMS
jgi:hypothetical protein